MERRNQAVIPKLTHSPVDESSANPPSETSVFSTEIENSDIDVTPLRVLLVAPHTLVRAGLRGMLGEDFEIMGETTNCEDAKAFCLAPKRPHVAIVDLELPDMSGIEATRYLVLVHPELWVVVLVNSDEETVIMAAIRAGAKAVVIKTEPRQVLIDALETIRTGQTYLSVRASQRIVQHLRASAVQALKVSERLTARELQVLRLMGEALQTKEIAVRLGLTYETARTHRKNAMKKIGATNAVEAVKIAERDKLFLLTGALPETTRSAE